MWPRNVSQDGPPESGLLLDEDRLRHHGTQAAGTQEPGERGDEMNEKNDQIAHFIVTKPGIACLVSQISNSPGTGLRSR